MGSPRDAAKKKREQLLLLVRDGIGPYEASRIVGHDHRWYDANRQRHPQWAQAVTEARLRNKDADLPGYDFVDFRQTYFDHDTSPHHYRMIEAFQDAQPGSTTVVLAFPGAGKSTLLVDKYNHILSQDPNETICVISEGQDLARKIIGQVSDRMSDEARFLAYHMRYGPFRPRKWEDSDRENRDLKRPWTADYFKIMAADADQKEPSLECRGATGRMYGARYKWMIFDDVQSNESIQKTPDLMRSMRTTWKSRTIFPDGKRGKVIMIGSRVGDDDIYAAMDKEGLIDNLVTVPALTKHVSAEEHYTRIGKKIIANPDCSAQPAWDRMSLQDLAEIRAFSGEEIWCRTYMQEEQVDSSRVFTEEMIEQAKDRTRGLGPCGKGIELWGAVDPALDTGVCAYLMTSVSSERMWILDSMGREDTHRYEDIFDWINTWSSKYHPSLWVIEQNNFQKGLLQSEQIRMLEKRWSFETVAHQTHRNKNDAIMGVRMMASAFAAGEISIPWGNDRAREVMQPLVDELLAWKPRTRGSMLKMDRVMSLWFTWLTWQQRKDAFNPNVYQLWRPTWVRKVV